MKQFFVFAALVVVAFLGASHAYAMGEVVQAASALPSLAPFALASAGLLVVPRAIHAMPRANANPAAMLAELKASFGEFKNKYDGRVNSLESSFQAALDDLGLKIAAGAVGGAVFGAPEDPEYSRAFATYARGGQNEPEIRTANMSGDRGQIRAAMSVGSNGDGGYLAPTEWDRRISKALVSVSPMRRMANVKTTSVGAYSTLWNTAAWGSGWVGETATRPNTSTTTLSPVIFSHGEIYANPAITQTLLDDAQFDLEQWLNDEVADEFTKQEGIAFVSGNGTNKPRGFLGYVTGGASDNFHPGGNLTIVPSGAAAALTPDGLIAFSASLPARYRQNAAWLMSSSTAAQVSTIKDGQGNYLWRPAFMAGQPATLLGFPVEIDENMPAVAAGNLSVAFGDFMTGYVINDRMGTRILRDPYTNKPYVNFYTTKRVGGGVADPNAIRLLKIAAS